MHSPNHRQLFHHPTLLPAIVLALIIGLAGCADPDPSPETAKPPTTVSVTTRTPTFDHAPPTHTGPTTAPHLDTPKPSEPTTITPSRIDLDSESDLVPVNDDHAFHPPPDPLTPLQLNPPPTTASPLQIGHWTAAIVTTTHPDPTIPTDVATDRRPELAPFLNAEFATRYLAKPAPLTTTTTPPSDPGSEEFAVGAVTDIASDNPELLGPFVHVTATVEITHTTATAVTGIEFVYITIGFTRTPSDNPRPRWQVTAIDRHHQPRTTS